MNIVLGSGFVLWAEARQTFGEWLSASGRGCADGPISLFVDFCAEKRWFGGIILLRKKHRLTSLRIDIRQWASINLNVHQKEVTMDEKRQMMRYRHELVEELKRFRGVEHVHVLGGEYIGQKDSLTLQLLMQQREAPQASKKRAKLSLGQLFERCRVEQTVAKPWSDPAVVLGR